jgi:hypothetical protein
MFSSSRRPEARLGGGIKSMDVHKGALLYTGNKLLEIVIPYF